MECSSLCLVIQSAVAVGTILVAVSAIWGERLRSWFAGPKLDVKLKDPRGYVIRLANGDRAIYYHIQVENRRRWAPAKRVRVLCTGVSKRGAGGRFVQQPWIIPLQLTWAFPQFHELLPNIPAEDVCDLGFVNEKRSAFDLSTYVRPNDFSGSISAHEAMRVTLIPSADNFTPKSPYVLEVSWDGKWSDNLEEMRKHLLIEEVAKR